MKGLRGIVENFKKFFVKRNDVFELENDDLQEGIKREKYDFSDSFQREHYIRSCLEQMSEASSELENLGREYEDLTLYLTDIEKIEEMPEDIRQELNHYAQQLLELNNNSEEMHNRKSLVSDEEFEHMQRLEEFMPAAYNKIKEAEDYQVLVKRDLARLDSEKQGFKMRKNELLTGQQNMKGMTLICLGCMIFLVIILSYLNMAFGLDVSLGIVIAVLISGMSLTFLFVKYNEATKEITRIDKSNNKLILLHNTVKIRYVNNTNLLDYLYIKYGVKSARSLKKIWDKYIEECNLRQKEEQTRNDIEFARTGLLRVLRRAKLEEPNIWIHQLEAILDAKNMMSMRHGLISQRSQIRKQMEYNAKLCEDAQNQVKDIAGLYPSQSKQILEMLKSYQKAI